MKMIIENRVNDAINRFRVIVCRINFNVLKKKKLTAIVNRLMAGMGLIHNYWTAWRHSVSWWLLSWHRIRWLLSWHWIWWLLSWWGIRCLWHWLITLRSIIWHWRSCWRIRTVESLPNFDKNESVHFQIIIENNVRDLRMAAGHILEHSYSAQESSVHMHQVPMDVYYPFQICQLIFGN